jgi:geranylgeranyl diphosphate synthase type II
MMQRYLDVVNTALEEALSIYERPEELAEAMRHALMTGGKRLRPVICLLAAEAVGGNMENARYAAAAIELLHNYTLVHDDLPSMDNDTLRRGKPTVWAKYGETTAVLAGDALQALAFQILAKTQENRPGDVSRVLRILAEKAVNVVRGQVEDLSRREDSDYYFIYEHKTADLFVAAAKMGAIIGGGSDEEVEAIGEYALNLGLAFQYEDDLLDGDAPWSKEETSRLVDESTSKALAALDRISCDTFLLSSLAKKLVTRSV